MAKKRSLYERIRRAIQSGQSGIWCRTREQDEAVLAIVQLVKEREPMWQLRLFDVIKGLRGSDLEVAEKSGDDMLNPESCLSAVLAMLALAEQRAARAEAAGGDEEQLPEHDKQNVILVVRNGHREIHNNGATNRELLMAIQHLLTIGKAHRCHLIILSYHGVEIPLELKEVMQIIDHDLPGFKDRHEIVADLLTGEENIDAARIDTVTTICGGLTRGQTEQAVAEAVMEGTDKLEENLRQLKDEIVNSTGMIEMLKGTEKFSSYEIKRNEENAWLFENETPGSLFRIDDNTLFSPGLGGLEGVKQFCLRILGNKKTRRIRPRGMLMLGIPGTGKSQFAKGLGNELGWPTLRLDIGALMGGIVGQTEENTRQALKIVDAMSPCILFVDEIEKGLSGVGSSGQTDSGVSARLFGSLLSWMNDHESLVYFIGTCNDISKLPPEFTRAGRVDATFFLDLPGREEKDIIWNIYLNGLGLDPKMQRPRDDVWTGAEIKQCCAMAHLQDVSLIEAAKCVIPKMLSDREKMRDLRMWANNRCLDAKTCAVYKFDDQIKVNKAPEGETSTGDFSGSRMVRKTRRSAE